MFTNIKKYSTGSPIQAPVEALLTLMGKYGLKASDIKSITARLGDRDASKTVADRSMPDINLKYLLAVTLLDGELTFAASHSFERMSDPAVLDLKKLITLVDDPVLVAAKPMRQGIVEVTTKDGSQLREHVVSVRGYVENPMTTEEVAKKCRELFIPVLGKERSDKLIDKIWNLEKVKNVRELRTLLSSS
jgi:2-methylcitrate dehydratase PrpD